MNPKHFKSSIVLSPMTRSTPFVPNTAKPPKQAAVLIPFVQRNGRLNLLLTQRAFGLKHHPGQISFPGGRYEVVDLSLKNTALRETFEETGIASEQVSIIASLGQYHTVSNYLVTPYVGFISPDYQLDIDHNEVADVFEVPWSFFAERENHHRLGLWRHDQYHEVHFMPFNDRFIWGTTAQIIHDLVSHFE